MIDDHPPTRLSLTLHVHLKKTKRWEAREGDTFKEGGGDNQPCEKMLAKKIEWIPQPDLVEGEVWGMNEVQLSGDIL